VTNDKRVEEIREKYKQLKAMHPYSKMAADMAFLLSELDRARKVVEAARQEVWYQHAKQPPWGSGLKFTSSCECHVCAALAAYDAIPDTEKKNGN
jgi:hypothetical protein